jgi:Na+-transporting NADH:ubiquinone oxidoreductase subunit B
MAKKPSRILARQPINRRVLLALLPCVGGAVYFFGWRCLFLVVWAAAVAFVTELIFTRGRNEPVSEAVFVTSTILGLIMPPTVPLHVLTIATVFAVMFGKEVFGGYRYNIFNPAMAGRCFVYICFPVALTCTWAPVATGYRGALDKWTTAPTTDATTAATPITELKAGKIILQSSGGETAIPQPSGDLSQDAGIRINRYAFLKILMVGRISGTMGVTSVILVLVGGVYLFYTKTASRTIILSLIITYGVLNEVLYRLGVEPVPGALPALLGGGFLFGAFFMATDPISAPRTEQAKIIYGILIAVATTVIRSFSIFNGGLMFSILIGNMFAPVLDYVVKARQASKTAREAG